MMPYSYGPKASEDDVRATTDAVVDMLATLCDGDPTLIHALWRESKHEVDRLLLPARPAPIPARAD